MKISYCLLLLGFVTLQGVAQQNLPPSTIRDIYNFEVGDTFEYHEITMGSYNSSIDRVCIVTDKKEGSDSISYTIHEINSGRCNYHPCNSNEFIDYTYTHLDSLIFYDHLQEPFHLDTVFFDSTFLHAKLNWHSLGDRISVYNETMYGDGLGITKLSSATEDDRDIDRYVDMRYYHKMNGATAGTALNIVTAISNPYGNNPGVEIYPNPTFSLFQLQLDEMPDEHTFFKLFDELGRLVKRQLITERTSAIYRNELANGIYFWQVEQQGKILNRGKVILQ